jgi:hypothetical protein
MISALPAHPRSAQILRLWSAGAMLLGLLLFLCAAGMFLPTLRDGYFESTLTASLATAWFLAFEALFVFMFSIGRNALKTPSAESLRRLIILSAWIFWIVGSSIADAWIEAIQRPGGTAPAPTHESLAQMFCSSSFMIASLFVCRALDRWAKRNAPLPTEERAKLPDGLRPETIRRIALLVALSAGGAVMDSLRHPSSPAIAIPESVREYSPPIGLAIGIAIAVVVYKLLKRSLVAEDPRLEFRPASSEAPAAGGPR